MHRIALRTPALFPKPQVKNTLRIPIYQLDAFASAPFKGNPAAVCPLDAWLRRSHAVCPTACTLGPAQASPQAMRGWLWARSACPKRHEPEQASGAPARVASHRRLEWCCTEWCCTACAACGHLTPRSTVLLLCEHCALTTRWLPDETLIAIASENNLSETAFVVSYGKP